MDLETRQEIARVNRRWMRELTQLDLRVQQMRRELDEPDARRIHAIIEQYGVVTLTPQERDVFREDLADLIVDKIVKERQGARTRFWDHRWTRWATISAVIVNYVTIWGVLIVSIHH